MFFDTETTGPIHNPRVVQVAYRLCQSPEEIRLQSCKLIKPEDFLIETTHIHGITQEAANEGCDLIEVLLDFQSALDQATLIVCHNVLFDVNAMRGEFLRKLAVNPFENKPTFCTMKNPKVICWCAIYDPCYGFKQPKLTELYHRLFGQRLDQKHRADSDMDALAKCFFELIRLGVARV